MGLATLYRSTPSTGDYLGACKGVYVYVQCHTMKRYNFFLPEELKKGLESLNQRDGIGESEAIRRAIAEYLKKRGIAVKEKGAKRKRSK